MNVRIRLALPVLLLKNLRLDVGTIITKRSGMEYFETYIEVEVQSQVGSNKGHFDYFVLAMTFSHPSSYP